MKLTLTNFRCFKQLSIDLPNTGVVLLWGTSGIGKTTVFKAIHFVLYGKEQKIVSFGEKKCKVEFSFSNSSGDYTIIRTRSPNHLTLQRINASNEMEWFVEDDVAQQKIYELFGKDFLLTSYMAQKGIESFFNLSNNEKATFLQNLSLKDFDVDSIRKKIKEIIRTRKDKLISTQTKLTLLEQSTHPDYVIAPPKLKVDLKEKTLQEFKGDDEQLSQKLKKYIRDKSVQLSSLQKEYSELNRLQKEYEISQSILDEKQLQLQTIENKLSQLQLLSDEEMEQNNEELTKYTNLLFANGLQRKLEFCKEEFDKMLMLEEERKQKEIQTIQGDIDKLTPYILVDESEIALLTKLSQSIQEIAVIVRDVKLSCDTAEELIEIEEILSDNIETTKEKLKELHNWDREEDYNKLKRDIQTIQHNILQLNELITKGTTSGYHCPQCNIPFYIDTKSSQIKTLRSDPKVLRIELQQLKDDKIQKENSLEALEQERTLFYKREETIRTKSIKLQSIYNSFLKVYKPIQDDLQTVEEPFQDLFERLKQHRQNLTQYKTLEIKLQQVKNIKINSQKAVLQKQQQITQLQNELTHYIIPDEDWHEEYIQVQIDNCKERITIHKQTEKVYTQLEKEKVSIQKEIDKISHLVSQQDKIGEVEQSIQDLESSLKLKQNNVDKLELRLKKLYKYEQELSEYEEQQNLLQQIKDCKSEERLILRGISKAELLSRRVGDAESLSLQQTIDRINGDIEEYITAFFDDTCSAHLSAFKETKDKDKKSLIDIEFSRNGEMVSIDSLSGGEYDRLALALFLSFGSQSPVMMLDECLASLHSELVEEIIEKIQEKMSHKLVLFTLHQANTGIFDHIIDVEKLAGGCCRQL